MEGEDEGKKLYAPSELYTRDSAPLVSATAHIVDDERMSVKVKDLLGLRTKGVSLEQVLAAISCL